MAYVNYVQKEDMQDDTYKIVATLIIDAIFSLQQKDVKNLHSKLDALYLLTWKKLDDKTGRALEALADKLYNDKFLDPKKLSQCFDEARAILKDITGKLTEAHILFRMEANLDELVARRSS